MTMEKIDFIQKNEKLDIFVASLTLSIIDVFINSHLIKSLVSFSTSLKITKSIIIEKRHCGK